jgi:hypothetical protein
MSSTFCDPFWTENPYILYTRYMDFFPFTAEARNCSATALNALTRFGLYLGILLSLLYRSSSYLGITIGLGILSAAAFYGMKTKGTLREGFTDIVGPTLFTVPGTALPNMVGGEDVAGSAVADVIGITDRTLPTGPNPFMNVLINELKDNPTRGPAITSSDESRKMSDVFQTRMYGDPTDVFQHNQNQRTWVVQPNTSIPNDQESFQNWLFRVPGRTCKEGNNAACRSGTEGGVVTWLSSP